MPLYGLQSPQHSAGSSTKGKDSALTNDPALLKSGGKGRWEDMHGTDE